jgi:pimeloyl-ACP methyl ester carboxylesterase
VKHGVLDDPAVFEVLDDDSLQQLRRNTRVPDTIGIHDHDGTSRANAQTRRLASFYASWTEQQPRVIEKVRQHLIKHPALVVWRAEATGANENVPGVRLHTRQRAGIHSRYLSAIMPQRITIAGLSALMERPPVETGAPILFVHGYFGRAIAFERMMSWFASHGHRCVAVDLRGHGDSMPDIDLGNTSIHEYADDVARAAAEMENPVIIGHSMGGLIAQIVATRGYARGIALLAPAPPRGIPVISLRLAIAQVRYMPAILLSRRVTPGRADLRALVVNRVPEKEREVVLDMLVPDSGRAGREMSIVGVSVDKSRIRVPVLVIAGDEDLFIPLSRARRVAARYDAPIRVAPGRGHMLIIEPGYEEVCGWIDDWIQQPIRKTSPAISAP